MLKIDYVYKGNKNIKSLNLYLLKIVSGFERETK